MFQNIKIKSSWAPEKEVYFLHLTAENDMMESKKVNYYIILHVVLQKSTIPTHYIVCVLALLLAITLYNMLYHRNKQLHHIILLVYWDHCQLLQFITCITDVNSCITIVDVL